MIPLNGLLRLEFQKANKTKTYNIIKLIRFMYKLAPYFSASGEDFYVLKDRRGRILNVAPTEHGLTWTTNMAGKLIYFTNAKIKVSPTFAYVTSIDGGPLKKSRDYYVEKMNYKTMPHTN